MRNRKPLIATLTAVAAVVLILVVLLFGGGRIATDEDGNTQFGPVGTRVPASPGP